MKTKAGAEGLSRPTASKIEHFTGQMRGGRPVKTTASTGFMERAMGIEPPPPKLGRLEGPRSADLDRCCRGFSGVLGTEQQTACCGTDDAVRP